MRRPGCVLFPPRKCRCLLNCNLLSEINYAIWGVVANNVQETVFAFYFFDILEEMAVAPRKAI